ncbi:hypothetical protein [Streptomyces longwoodensis]|uniref:hypothetical protein n=1 Tax=Streptomyces longwoodensis TaxID=68231 RepID=UPI00384E4667
MVGLFLAEWLLVSSSACRNASGWGCVGVVVWWGDATPFVLLVVGWPVLRMLGVRPAWLTALLGAGLSWYLLRYLTAVASLPVPPGGVRWVQFALPTAAFALAAWFTASLRRWLPRVATVVALALVVPVNTFALSQVNDSRQNAALSASSVPLLGPQIPRGYHIEGVGTETLTAPTFYYRLAPDGRQATTTAELQREIQVFVAPVQPQFTPPVALRRDQLQLSRPGPRAIHPSSCSRAAVACCTTTHRAKRRSREIHRPMRPTQCVGAPAVQVE